MWDFPRPPRVERCARRVRVVYRDILVADSRRALRVLETSHPPAIYIPPIDVRMDLLSPTTSSTWCEFKGRASYWALDVDGKAVADVAWSYRSPSAGFESIVDHLSFYPARVDACLLDEEVVIPQQGSFYGGWISADIVGPFKGGVGTIGW